MEPELVCEEVVDMDLNHREGVAVVQARLRRTLANLQKGESGVRWFGMRFGKIVAESVSVGVVYTVRELFQIYLGKMKKGERMVARGDKREYEGETRSVETWEEAHQVLMEAEEKKSVNLEVRVHGTRSAGCAYQKGKGRKDWSRGSSGGGGSSARCTPRMHEQKGAGRGPMQGGGAGKGKGSWTPNPVRMTGEAYVTEQEVGEIGFATKKNSGVC